MKRNALLLLGVLALMHSTAQNVSLLTIDEMNERIQKGKDTTFVIHFWATWCTPCIKELPFIEKLNAEHKVEKIKVMLVSVDYVSNLHKTVKPFVKKRKLLTDVFILNEKDQQTYIDRIDKQWSGTIPATLFVRGDRRRFAEREFTYEELVNEYKSFQ